MKAPQKYLGLHINVALTQAQLAGDQLRVMAINHITHRHSEEDQANHDLIKVWVKDGLITRAE